MVRKARCFSQDVALSFVYQTYLMGARDLKDQLSALAYPRYQLDRLKTGSEPAYSPRGNPRHQTATFQFSPGQQLK